MIARLFSAAFLAACLALPARPASALSGLQPRWWECCLDSSDHERGVAELRREVRACLGAANLFSDTRERAYRSIPISTWHRKADLPRWSSVGQ